VKASFVGNEIRIDDGFLFKESIKAIEGRRFDSVTKAWYVPLSEANIALFKMLGAEFDESAATPEDAGTVINDEPPAMNMPIKAKPYRHQVAAFNFALRVFGGSL
jgi:hypothetical protein